MLIGYSIEGVYFVRIEHHEHEAKYLARICTKTPAGRYDMSTDKYLPIELSRADIDDLTKTRAKILEEKFLMDTWQGSTGILWS